MEQIPKNKSVKEQRHCKICGGETIQEKTILTPGTSTHQTIYGYKCLKCGNDDWAFSKNEGNP